MQGSEEAPKAPLGNNARPVQPLHQRTIRTNINFRNSEVSISTSFLIQRIPLTFIAPGKLSPWKGAHSPGIRFRFLYIWNCFRGNVIYTCQNSPVI